MAIITFPNSPTNGQEFTDPNGTDWKYIVNRWEQLYQAFTASDIALVDLVGLYTATDVEGALAEVHQDKAPLASPTFTGVTTVADLTATEPITVARTTPKIFLQDTNQPADAQLWRFQGNNDLFALAAVNDDETTVQLQVFTADRTTGVVSFNQGSITAFQVPDGAAPNEALAHSQDNAVLGSTTTGALTATGNVTVGGQTFLNDNVTIAKNAVIVVYEDTGGTADRRKIRWTTDADATEITSFTDANAVKHRFINMNHENGAMVLTPSGSVTVPAPTAADQALRWGSDAEVGALTATGNVDMSSTPAVVVPAPTASDHAAQLADVTAVDDKIAALHSAGALPPVSPVPGTMWVMAPLDHVAIYSASGWLPVFPQTDNQAVVTGNAFTDIDGLWVAEEGD